MPSMFSALTNEDAQDSGFRRSIRVAGPSYQAVII